MLSLMDLEPFEKSRSFFTARFRSRTDAVGLRLPIELIHSTRFFFASRCMMCFLLSGSLSQSLLKQMISLPSIMRCPPQPLLDCHCRLHGAPPREVKNVNNAGRRFG